MAIKKGAFGIHVFVIVSLMILAGCARTRATESTASKTDEGMAAQETLVSTESKQGVVAPQPGAIKVVEAAICTDVQNREPVGAANSFPADVKRVCCWSKIANGQGQTIKHVYYYSGSKEAVVELAIGSPMWRTYSSKTIPPGYTGQWRVDIVDVNGNVLKSLSFTVGS